MTAPLAAKDRLIVALDAEAHEALSMAHALEGVVRWVKVGMTLYYEAGPQVVTRLRDRGFEVFVDLKLHDIPHQVEGAAERVGRLGAGMLTVHASGGEAMIAAAREGSARGADSAGVERPVLLAVTVLTSMNDAMLASVGVERPAAEQASLLAGVARDGGADGVVCSPHEAQRMREVLGDAAAIVTPGVRPAWAATGDQQRIATPQAALAAGASHLVVGRPITGAANPVDAARRIIDEMEGAS